MEDFVNVNLVALHKNLTTFSDDSKMKGAYEVHAMIKAWIKEQEGIPQAADRAMWHSGHRQGMLDVLKMIADKYNK